MCSDAKSLFKTSGYEINNTRSRICPAYWDHSQCSHMGGSCWSNCISVVFLSRGDFFLGTAVITLFALSDLFDGTMARISKAGASKWGSFLDSTIDRVTDSAILLGVSIYLINHNDQLSFVSIATLVTGMLVPYIRAKAESFGVECSGGIAERTERLIMAMSAIALDGLGVPYVLAGGMWLLAGLGAVTVVQRMLIVRKAFK